MSGTDAQAALSVLAYVPDLMDRSRLSGAVAATDPPITVRFAASFDDVLAGAEGADVAVVDLARTEVLGELAALAAAVPVVAFGSHVDQERLDAARTAGCRLVLPRSRFFADIPAALATARSSRSP